jgi:hypothetical protein
MTPQLAKNGPYPRPGLKLLPREPEIPGQV